MHDEVIVASLVDGNWVHGPLKDCAADQKHTHIMAFLHLRQEFIDILMHTCEKHNIDNFVSKISKHNIDCNCKRRD